MTRLPDPSLPWPVPMEAVALVAEFETCRLKAYRCPAGKWTCGWGSTIGVTPTTVWTQEQADRRFCDDMIDFTADVQAMLTVPPSPYELGAMVSLTYNIGPGNPDDPKSGGFANSTVRRAHNRGDRAAAARAFALWNKARVNGALTVLNGLTRRRAAEAALYLKEEHQAMKMPQAVEPESSIAASPIAKSGATVTAAGVVTAAAEAQDQLGVVGGMLAKAREVIVGTLGVPTEWFLPALMVIAGVIVVRWRAKQRRDGWA